MRTFLKQNGVGYTMLVYQFMGCLCFLGVHFFFRNMFFGSQSYVLPKEKRVEPKTQGRSMTEHIFIYFPSTLPVFGLFPLLSCRGANMDLIEAPGISICFTLLS